MLEAVLPESLARGVASAVRSSAMRFGEHERTETGRVPHQLHDEALQFKTATLLDVLIRASQKRGSQTYVKTNHRER